MGAGVCPSVLLSFCPPNHQRFRHFFFVGKKVGGTPHGFYSQGAAVRGAAVRGAAGRHAAAAWAVGGGRVRVTWARHARDAHITPSVYVSGLNVDIRLVRPHKRAKLLAQ